MTVSQVTGLHKCDDCLQCQEFDQGQFLFVLTQFVRLSLALAPHSPPLIGGLMSSVSPLCDSGWRNLNKIMTGLLCLALVTLGFYLQFHSHCLGARRHQGTFCTLGHIIQHPDTKMKYFCLYLI